MFSGVCMGYDTIFFPGRIGLTSKSVQGPLQLRMSLEIIAVDSAAMSLHTVMEALRMQMPLRSHIHSEVCTCFNDKNISRYCLANCIQVAKGRYGRIWIDRQTRFQCFSRCLISASELPTGALVASGFKCYEVLTRTICLVWLEK